MTWNIIRDLIVPPTRVRHALARVFFSSGPGAAAAALGAAILLCSGSPLAQDGGELGIDRETVGYHIRLLVTEGQLLSSKEGRYTVYQVKEPKVRYGS